MARLPKHFSEQDINEIETLASMGLTQKQIARIKGVCEETLRKHASDAWLTGKSKGQALVTKTAYEMAISGKFPGMTKFFLRTQCGWSEFQNLPESLKRIFRIEGNDDES